MYWKVKMGRTRENNGLIYIKTDWEADKHTDKWADNQVDNLGG